MCRARFSASSLVQRTSSCFKITLASKEFGYLLRSHFGDSKRRGLRRICTLLSKGGTAYKTLQYAMVAKGNASKLATKTPIAREKVDAVPSAPLTRSEHSKGAFMER